MTGWVERVETIEEEMSRTVRNEKGNEAGRTATLSGR